MLSYAALLCLAVAAGCSSGHKSAASHGGSAGSSTAIGSGTPSQRSSPARSGAATTGGSGAKASPSQSGGVENPSSSPTEKCQLASSAAVAVAFAAKVAKELVSTSGIGSPLCQFLLAKPPAGPYGAVSATAVAKYPAAAFAQSKAASPGAQPLPGLGTSAFYVPKNNTVKVLYKGSALTLQYIGYVAAGEQPAADRIRSALISLATSYTAHN